MIYVAVYLRASIPGQAGPSCDVALPTNESGIAAFREMALGNAQNYWPVGSVYISTAGAPSWGTWVSRGKVPSFAAATFWERTA